MDVAGLPMPPDATTMDPESAIPPARTESRAEEAAWSPAKRLGFRFLAVLVALYSAPFPLNFLPWIGDAVGEGVSWVWRFPQRWVGAWVFGLTDLSFETTGSGDRTVDYLMLLLLVVRRRSAPSPGRCSTGAAGTTGGRHAGSRWWCVISSA